MHTNTVLANHYASRQGPSEVGISLSERIKGPARCHATVNYFVSLLGYLLQLLIM